MTNTILVATWGDGLFVIAGETQQHELAGQPVQAVAADAHGGALAIVSGHSLRRRSAAGEWLTLATSPHSLSCCAPAGDAIYVGTDDARVLRVRIDGELEELPGLESVAGRDRWYAGSAVIDGRRIGPPLGIRSIAATVDAGALLANVHVGGIPRSTDEGATWQPTIDIDADVHEVRAHPTDRDLVIAAAAIGLCISRDAGATWDIERDGLHASYCSAVAFLGDDILVSASSDHFAADGAVYRRPINRRQPLVPAGGGLPRWMDGIVETRGIGTDGAAAAIVDRGGNLYVSADAGRTWQQRACGLPQPSSVVSIAGNHR
jgi:hypothetical protein